MRLHLCVVVLAAFLPCAASQPVLADLVSNGGFETGDFTDWNYTSSDRFSFVASGFAHGGIYAAWLGDSFADGGGSISQSLVTSIGEQYTLNFWLASNGDIPSGFTALVGGNTLFQVTDPPFDSDYKLHTFSFNATSGTTLLEFDFYDDPFYINLDDVSVIPSGTVPEPNSMISLGIGLAALVGYRRTRRNRAR